MDEEEISAAEKAREKKRDRDADARARAGMRTGLAKQFKQVLDVQRQRADEVERREESETGTDAHGKRKGKTRGA